MEDCYQYMQRIDREQHAEQMRFSRHVVCVGLSVRALEEDPNILRAFRIGRRVGVNCWTDYAWEREVARQTAPVYRIDPITGARTEIVHRISPAGQRSETNTT